MQTVCLLNFVLKCTLKSIRKLGSHDCKICLYSIVMGHIYIYIYIYIYICIYSLDRVYLYSTLFIDTVTIYTSNCIIVCLLNTQSYWMHWFIFNIFWLVSLASDFFLFRYSESAISGAIVLANVSSGGRLVL